MRFYYFTLLPLISSWICAANCLSPKFPSKLKTEPCFYSNALQKTVWTALSNRFLRSSYPCSAPKLGSEERQSFQGWCNFVSNYTHSNHPHEKIKNKNHHKQQQHKHRKYLLIITSFSILQGHLQHQPQRQPGWCSGSSSAHRGEGQRRL